MLGSSAVKGTDGAATNTSLLILKLGAFGRVYTLGFSAKTYIGITVAMNIYLPSLPTPSSIPIVTLVPGIILRRMHLWIIYSVGYVVGSP